MCDFKSDAIYQITYKVMDSLEERQVELLKNTLNVVLADYNITKKETAITVYSGNELDYMIKKFLVTKKVEGCSDRTIDMYGRTIPVIIRKINKPIKDITSDDILLYIANRALNDGIAKTTQDNELRYLRTFFAWLQGEGYVNINPCSKLKAIKTPKTKKPAFTEIDIERIRNACRNNKDKALIEFLLSTGCRAEETVSITINDIDEDKIIINGKGNKERIVYLNAKAQIAIENYLNERNDNNPYLFPKIFSLTETIELRKTFNCNIDYKNPVFVHLSEPASKHFANGRVKEIGKIAGVNKVHAHRFRRTCATFALKRGMPLLQVSKMLGHESIGTTQIYLDISEDELEISHKKYVV